jgi:hypothetical protein
MKRFKEEKKRRKGNFLQRRGRPKAGPTIL